MKNLFLILFITTILINSQVKGQPWTQNDNIFNPSGVPSLTFSQPRFADLDGDDDFDMILGSVGENPLYLENTGSSASPMFVPGADIFENVQSLDAEVGVFSDIDSDDDLDLISGGFTGLNLYKNIGTSLSPVFEKQPGIFNGLEVGQNPIPDFGDLDGDGDYDMVVGISESGLVKIYMNMGTPQEVEFNENNVSEVGDVGLYAYPHFCDIDQDEDQDLLLGRDSYGFVYYENTGNSTTAVWEINTTAFDGLGNDSYWNSPGLADLDDDGLTDLVFGTYAGPLKYYLNTGTSSAPDWTENTTLFGGVIDIGGASNPYFFDFDNDGDLDMFTGTQLGDIKYFENTGTITGPAWEENSSPFASLKHSIYSAVAMGDVNNDGLPDAIVGDLNGGLYYHRNTGDGFVKEPSFLQAVALGGWSAPRLADFDGDEDLDIIAGNESGNLTYIQNGGTPEDPEWSVVANFFGTIDVGMNCVPTVYDVDMDGDVDILCGNLSGSLTYFENQGGEWIQNNEIFMGISGEQNTTPALADLDGDGDPDLTLGQYSGIFNYWVNHSVATGISLFNNKDIFNASIYPNPVIGKATIEMNGFEKEIVQLQILDLKGHIVLKRKFRITDVKYKYSLELDQLEPGVYIVSLTSKSRVYIVKFLKN
ncbi:MAG: T9SS type A sorting domain-containing protein [Bacteroidetes bacterium]|nr:T9SS type A sorting domain-containing protein [Bacteroidota bacterium]